MPSGVCIAVFGLMATVQCIDVGLLFQPASQAGRQLLAMHSPLPPRLLTLPGTCAPPLCAFAGGGSPPWVPRSVSPKIPWLDRAAIALFDKFARSAIKTGRLRFVLPSGEELCYGDASATAAPVPKGAPRRAVPAALCGDLCACGCLPAGNRGR